VTSSHLVLRRSALALSLLLTPALPALAGAAPADPATRVASALFQKSAAGIPVGGRLHLENLQADDSSQPLAFDLQRFEVFAADAEITIHGKGGQETKQPAPKNVYFRGTVDGEPGSRVFLAALADGRTQGIVNRGDYVYLIGADDAPAKAAGGPLLLQWVNPTALERKKDGVFACAEDRLPAVPGSLASVALGDDAASFRPKSETAALPGYTARVAIETDFEFFNLPAFGGSTTNVTNYIGNLIGYSSTIYVNEINTSMVVQSVSLWTGGAGSDPWTQTSTLCGLMEFGKYWNVNRTGVSRTTAHFMSGKGLGGGIAWVGVLCSGSFSSGAAASCPALGTESTPWGGAYGFTASLSGTFNINSPTVMWDIVAVSHEIGHNFNSPHTHCYNGIGGNSSPIDQCRSGEQDGHGLCYSGSQTLPGPSGSGSGTLMSYCHLLSGGFGNISLNFGTGHPFGVAPDREAARMTAHVVSVASGNRSCLAYTPSGGSAPTVTAVSPSTGSTAGGNTVTLTGTNFVSGATVTFGTGGGAAAGTGVNVVNSTTITVTAPAHATGTVRVTVTNPDAQAGFKDGSYFYAPPPSASGFFTITPCRLIDTRNAAGPLGGPSLAANSTRLFTVTGVCGVPSSAKAVSINVTVVPLTTNTGSFTFYPGNAFPLGTTNLNFSGGKTRAAASIVQLATDGSGSFGVQNSSSGANQLLVDVNGYFQ
jgi:hypothetical protein